MELLDDCELLFQQVLDNVSHRHVVGQPNSVAHRDELPASASKRKHPLTASTMSLIDYPIKRRKSSRVTASSRIPPLDIVRSSIKHITCYHLRSSLFFSFFSFFNFSTSGNYQSAISATENNTCFIAIHTNNSYKRNSYGEDVKIIFVESTTIFRTNDTCKLQRQLEKRRFVVTIILIQGSSIFLRTLRTSENSLFHLRPFKIYKPL